MVTRTKAPARQGKTMSAAHRAALAEGREQGVMVRRYLEALESTKRPLGRGRTAQSIARRIQTIQTTMAAADVLARLELITEKQRLEAELQEIDDGVDLLALEADFVAVAAAYSIRRGISYASWRTVGVSASVLRTAGVPRGSRSGPR